MTLHAMPHPHTWVWILAFWGVELAATQGSVSQLTQKDILLLEDEENPKCFSRTQEDLTCFWEARGNMSYELFYRIEETERRCDLSQQGSEDHAVLHVCLLPPSDVYLFVPTHLRVVDSANRTVYSRNISVEEQVLLDPPRNVSLHPTGEPGQLLVAWHMPKSWETKGNYGIRFSSQSLQEKTDLVMPLRRLLHRLESLVPGEVCQVAMRVRPARYQRHWSDWSRPVTAMVPQPAADISLLCHTSDLRDVVCRWNDRAYEDASYTLYFKQSPSGSGDWQLCSQESAPTGRCRFHGDVSSKLRVYLSVNVGSLSRTFYTRAFWMNQSIQSHPPERLRTESRGGRLRLQWDTPLPTLAHHLEYLLRYRPTGDSVWKLVTLASPETSTSLDVQAGGRYCVQLKARPNGSVYKGSWSDWTEALTVDVSSNTGVALLTCVPAVLLLLSIVAISLFSRYFRKLKLLLWPPVPNLEKVLERFLTDIKAQTWDSTFNTKQCPEDTPASVLEVMFEGEAPVTGKALGGSRQALPSVPEGDESGTGPGLEASQDYVILETEESAPCLRGNEYVYMEAECSSVRQREELLQEPSIPSDSTDILNRSYLLPVEQEGVVGR